MHGSYINKIAISLLVEIALDALSYLNKEKLIAPDTEINIMQNIKKGYWLNYWFKKSISTIGMAGVSALIGLPVLSQSYYPPMVFFQPLAYPNYPQRNENGDLIDSLENNTNFKNLIAEIEAAGLTEELEQQQLTLLAPSDEAFNALPDEVFDKFSEPENRIKVLQYHLIPGEVTEEDIQRGKITTLAGEEIAISQDNNTIKLNDAAAEFPSIVAKNGVVIQIDRVLLPADF